MDELNEVRPLQLADEVKSVISSPALNLNPISHGRPVTGKLARCNNQGGLSVNDNSGFENYEYIVTLFEGRPMPQKVTFAQKLKGLYLPQYEWFYPFTTFEWVDAGTRLTIQTLHQDASNWLKFTGTEIWIRGNTGFNEFYLVCLGFY
ncbi:hypothetical protein ES703_28839 [subsurface metagenome]